VSVSSRSLLRDPALYWAIAVLTLLSGASFVYVSIKAPFFWGGIYVPGVILLNAWAISTIVGVVLALQRRRLSH
jgi:hypothetical protein